MEKRYEIKFPINQNEMVEILYFIKMNKFYKSYPSRSINSLYFDTIDNISISIIINENMLFLFMFVGIYSYIVSF